MEIPYCSPEASVNSLQRESPKSRMLWFYETVKESNVIEVNCYQ